MYNQEDQTHNMSVEHIFEILNDVKAAKLPVSDAVDGLAYWFHEAFQTGEIAVEQMDENNAQGVQGEGI